VAAVEPASTAPPPQRPVWVGPVIFAAVGIVVVVLIAVVHRHDTRDDTATRSTTTTAVDRSTTTTRITNGPLGGPGNPLLLGSTGSAGGWTVAVLSPSDADGSVLASLRIVWNGTAGQTIGHSSQLSFRVLDAQGIEHELGGAACAGDPQGALDAVPGLDIGTSDTIPLCWTVTGAGRESSLLVVRVTAVPSPLYFALS
jgi:hypothetical protein